MGKVIVFNGPPGSGKDTAVDYLMEQGVLDFEGSVAKRQFKDRLFEITCVIHGVSYDLFTGDMYTRENKEKPYPELMTMTPREALIHTSESVIKPNFGPTYFGNALSQSIDTDLTLVPDSGFMEELVPVLAQHGRSNVMVVRIFREGFDYSKDSRDYLDADKLGKAEVLCVDIENEEGEEQEFLENVRLVVEKFLEMHKEFEESED